MTRVLLTGASGFIGSHALDHLLQNTDHDIVCPVTFKHKGDSQRLDIDSFDKDRVDIVYHDLCGPISGVLDDRIGKIDWVFNFAAESHVDRSITQPRPFIENNVASILTLMEWAASHSEIKGFFQVSTDEVYGPAKAGHDHLEWAPIVPSNPYSASKAAQEAVAISYWRTYGVPVVLTNTMNNIGERQDSEKFVPLVISGVMQGRTVPIHIDPVTGKPGSRFYLHARNHADALVFLTKHIEPAFSLFPNRERPYRFNVVGDREIDNLEMARLIAKMLGRPLHYELVDAHSSRPGHDPRYGLDGSKLQDLGWKPPVDIETALSRTVQWAITHPEWLAKAA